MVMELMELGEATTKKPHLSTEWAEFLSSLLFPAQVLSNILAVRREARDSPYAGGEQMSSLSHLSCLPAVDCVPTAALWASDPRTVGVVKALEAVGTQHLPWNLKREGQQAGTSGQHTVPSILSPCLPPTVFAAFLGLRSCLAPAYPILLPTRAAGMEER